MTHLGRRTLALIVLLSMGELASASEVTVRGRVVTAEGTPIAGVEVQASRRGEEGRPIRTDSNGEYVVGLDSGAPIALIQYRHSSFDLASIANVSGRDLQQRIVKVMYRVGQTRSIAATSDTVSAYEQFALSALSGEGNRGQLSEFSKQLELSNKLSKLPIASAGDARVQRTLQDRQKAVMSLLEAI